MVTNSLYKSYSSQIAKLFCKDQGNKVLCEAGIEERLNTFLDDSTYPYFLAKLSSGRQYISNVESLQNKGFRFVVTDLITGLRETGWFEHSYNLPYYSKIPTIILSHKYNIISGNKTYSNENWSDNRITWNPVKESYGITFVPGNVGTGGGGSGGSGGPGGGGEGGGSIGITTTGGAGTGTGAGAGFDIQSLISNPLILVGVGLAVYFLLIKK